MHSHAWEERPPTVNPRRGEGKREEEARKEEEKGGGEEEEEEGSLRGQICLPLMSVRRTDGQSLSLSLSHSPFFLAAVAAAAAAVVEEG